MRTITTWPTNECALVLSVKTALNLCPTGEYLVWLHKSLIYALRSYTYLTLEVLLAHRKLPVLIYIYLHRSYLYKHTIVSCTPGVAIGVYSQQQICCLCWSKSCNLQLHHGTMIHYIYIYIYTCTLSDRVNIALFRCHRSALMNDSNYICTFNNNI